MSNQISNTQVVTADPGKGLMSRWWPIGLFCASVFFFILGGGLLGAWASSDSCAYNYYDSYFCDGNLGEWNGGVACLAIGGVLKFAFWVVLVVWCIRRRRSRAPSTVVYVNAQAAAEAGTAGKAQTQANVYSAPQPDYSGVQPAPQYNTPVVQHQGLVTEKNGVTRYCGQCGSGTVTPFCAQCGSKVP